MTLPVSLDEVAAKPPVIDAEHVSTLTHATFVARNSAVELEEGKAEVFKLIWDAMGNQEQIRLDTLRFARLRGISASQQELVERCLSDYDLDGWRDPTWTA